MTLIRPEGDGGQTPDRLDLAEEQIETALELFRDFLKVAREGGSADGSKVKAATADLLRSVHLMMDARKKLDDERRKAAGIVHDYAVDFRSAKSEIRSLLDRLRTDRGSGGFSE